MMMIIDGHVHIFNKVNGKNVQGKTKSSLTGKIINASEIKPFIPPTNGITSFNIDVLEEYMLRNGVEKAVLLQNPTIGNVNDEIIKAVEDKPEKFAGSIQVDPTAKAASSLVRKFSKYKGIRALKLEMSYEWGWSGINGISYKDESVLRVIDTAAQTGLNIIIDTGPIGNPGYDIEGLEWLIN